MIDRELTALLAAVFLLSGAHVQAVPAIPQESGWSGHVNIAVGIGSSESNMLAEIAGQDLGDDTINSLDSGPDDEDVTLPALQFEAAYTFANMGMQLYLGNQVADHLSFDLDTTLETHAGIRQDLGEVGRVAISLAASSMPTDVWKDPYITDSPRGNTERTSMGLHLAWDQIFSTPFELTYASREIEIDDERSGEDSDLGLTSGEQRTLDREGQLFRVDLNYDWVINEHHRLVPGIGYIDADLDGAALAEDGIVVQLQHLYSMNRWRVVSKVFFEDLESDATNPIYDEQNETETLGGSVTVFFKNPFGLDGWTANASAAYYDGDANIDFYDSSFALFSVGMLYRFNK